MKKNIDKEGPNGDFFYCYSRRMALFIRAMGIQYVEIGEHPITKAPYTKFYKSKKLDQVMSLWREIRYQYDNGKE